MKKLIIILALIASTVSAQTILVTDKSGVGTNSVQKITNVGSTSVSDICYPLTNTIPWNTTIQCVSGEIYVWGGAATNQGGGYYLSASNSISISYPTQDNRTWHGQATNGNARVSATREPQP